MESVHITVDWRYLESHASTGIDMRIYGEKGEADLVIPPAMIEAFFSCMEPLM